MTDDPSTLEDRMAGDYEPPILVEPVGGPIPVAVNPEDSAKPDK
jgi:hypothetical protein